MKTIYQFSLRFPLSVGWRNLVFGVVHLFGATVFAQNPNSIVFSKHNLSVSGPGTVRATTESDICIFCHTPHQASGEGPLWNHQLSGATYTPYTSATLKAAVGQPDGASRLCLGCHDGTVALGMMNSRPGGIAMNSAAMPVGLSNLGTDLSADHPVSFTYDNALVAANGNLRPPNTLVGDVRLDRAGKVQCTSCHDPHNNQFGNFLVTDNTGAALCTSCHTINSWTSSGHALSAAPVPVALARELATARGSAAKNAAPTVASVATAACSSCHVPHVAGGEQQLLRVANPEKNCLTCHSAEGPGKNVAAALAQISGHGLSTVAGAHAAKEDLINPPTRHVTCVDCHNPHAANQTPAGAGKISGALNAVAGVSSGGARLTSISQEQELCYRCHGDSAQRGPASVPRQFPETNTRREFSPGNISAHPVERANSAARSASLLPPLTASSTIRCTDCHNSNQGPGNGGSGAAGPHGSAFTPLLERPLLLTDGTPYSAANFALCYKCHSETVINSESTASWRYHRQHLVEFRAACTTCHDSHAANQPQLINFNPTYAQPYRGVLRFTATGVKHGTCTLTCHDGQGRNHVHNAENY